MSVAQGHTLLGDRARAPLGFLDSQLSVLFPRLFLYWETGR